MKKLIGSVLCCFLLISSHTALAYEKEIKALSSTMAEKIAKAGKKNVAVVDFTDLQGSTTELGRFLAEELSSDLAEVERGFEIVDRNNLKTIMTEHKFSISGLVDPKTVKDLGRIAGVDAIVTGSVTPFGDSVRVSARVITTDTAKVIATAKGDIAKTKAIEELLAKGIIDTGTPGEPATIPSPKPAVRGQEQLQVDSFLFQLQGCGLSGQTVTCNLLVTNKDEDRDIVVAGDDPNWGAPLISRAFDDHGGEYNAESVSFGNKGPARKGGAYHFISGVPTPVKISFGGVSTKSSKISLLDIQCVTGATTFYGQIRGKAFRVQFRNILMLK